LEDVCAFDHLLEGLYTEDLLDLGVKFVVIDEVGLASNPVHETFHDVFGGILVQHLRRWLLSLASRKPFHSAGFSSHLVSIFLN